MYISACRSLQTPRCEIDAEKMQNAQCYPITSYQKWNECVSTCENMSEKPPSGEPNLNLTKKKRGLDPDLTFTPEKKIMKFDFDYYNFYETFAINQDFVISVKEIPETEKSVLIIDDFYKDVSKVRRLR